MSKMPVTVEVEKETYELAEAIAGFTGAVISHAREGKAVPQNIVESFTENLGKLTTGLAGADQIPSEAKEDIEAFADSIYLPLKKALFSTLKKAPAPLA